MKITKLLKVNAAAEVNAAMLSDGGEEYPIFLKSLHNTIMFDAMLESGYKLAGLPYDFVIDGHSIMELPVENYDATPDVEQTMYDMIGTEHEMSYLLSKVDMSVVRGLPIPPTNYTITTREKFLRYLEQIAVVNSDEDFAPLNYFVAPEARFSLSEYLDTANARYIRIIEQYRSMSYNKFQNLVKWLGQFGLSPNASFLDVLDAYFVWGFDGLNTPLLTKKRTQRAIENNGLNSPVVRKVMGLIDGSGNIYPPLNERTTRWQPDIESEDRLRRVYANLKDNEVTTLMLKATAPYDVIQIQGGLLQAEITEQYISINRRRQVSIRVMSPVENLKALPVSLAMPVNKSKMIEYCQAEAIAKDNYKSRKDLTLVSSYQVLNWSGVTPERNLEYILSKIKMLAMSSDHVYGENGVIKLRPRDVQGYLAGRRNPLRVNENNEEEVDPNDSLLYDIIHGAVNTDMVEKGLQKDMMVDTASLREILITLHETLGISYDEIYEKVANIPQGTTVVPLSNGELTYNLDIAPINNALRGYNMDMMSYDDMRANQCNFFYYVTLVALEIAGADGDKALSDRAVGIEALAVNLYQKKEAAALINSLVNKLLDAMEYVQLTPAQHEKLQESARRWAINSWFEIYARGTYTLPRLVGGAKANATPEMIQTVRNCTETKVDSTLGFCNTSLNVSEKEAEFLSYCVNAYVSIDRVIPRNENNPIHAIPFYAAWYDYKRTNPQLWGTLVEMGVLKEDFVAWEMRYGNEQLWKEGFAPLNSPTSLLTYCENARQFLAEYPADMEFISAPHFMDIAFPGLYEDVNQPEDSQSNSDETDSDCDPNAPKQLDTPRQGQPRIRAGLHQMLKTSELQHYLKPTETIQVEDTYLRPFSGFTSEVMIKCPNAVDKIPNGLGKSMVLCIPGSTRIQIIDRKDDIDYTRIGELDVNTYPVSHIYDRLWLIRSMDGRLWEAQI